MPEHEKRLEQARRRRAEGLAAFRLRYCTCTTPRMRAIASSIVRPASSLRPRPANVAKALASACCV